MARKRTLRLCRIKVVMFQLIIKTPIEKPTIAVLKKVTSPKYSGARKRELAPNVNIKPPATVENRIYQKIRNTWYLRKCSRKSCMGNERHIPTRYFFIAKIFELTN